MYNNMSGFEGRGRDAEQTDEGNVRMRDEVGEICGTADAEMRWLLEMIERRIYERSNMKKMERGVEDGYD